MILIIDLARYFRPGAIQDVTLTIYPGLVLALEKPWLVPPSGCFMVTPFAVWKRKKWKIIVHGNVFRLGSSCKSKSPLQVGSLIPK